MKYINKFIFTFIVLFTGIISVNASSATYSLSANKSTVIVGTTVNVTLKLSSSSQLGAWKYNIGYDSSRLTLLSGETYVVADSGGPGVYSKVFYLSFKAKASGSAYVSVTSAEAADYVTEKYMTINLPSIKLNCMTQAQIEATYSKNNNLSGLSVEGFTLDKAFDANSLEYSLEVENSVESINVLATKADSNATITGSGNIKLEEGVNTIKVVVTAQNGQEKTYTLLVTRKELDPINVKVDGVEYSVIRKKELLNSPNEIYILKTVTIDDKEVPCYYNEALDYTIVGLKDDKGNIKYYLYSNGKYTLYQQIAVSKVVIMPLDKEIKGFIKTTVKINDDSITCYKYKKSSRFCLLYGMNIETQKENI